MTQVTIDLGKVKFNWRGDYDNSTSYSKDDVVGHGGSSWVCVVDSISQSTPSASNTNWNLMALGGAPGDIMTTEGDLLARGATGLERVPIGATGEVLKVNDTGTSFEWGTSGLQCVKRTVYQPNPGVVTVTESYNWFGQVYVDYTPEFATTSDAKIIAHWDFQKGRVSGYGMLHGRYYENTSTELTKRSWAANDVDDQQAHFMWVHNGWSGNQRIGWKFRSYGSTHRPYLHRPYHFDGGSSSYYCQPQYVIEEWI
jgi:hypothetical protein